MKILDYKQAVALDDHNQTKQAQTVRQAHMPPILKTILKLHNIYEYVYH